MIPLGILLAGVVIAVIGARGLLGMEPEDKKTPQGVAIASVVAGIALAVFALVIWPMIFN